MVETLKSTTKALSRKHWGTEQLLHLPPPPCIRYANVRNYYGPYAHCSLDKGVAYTRGSMVGADRLNVPAIDTFSH